MSNLNKLNNQHIINSASDFPAPVGGLITLPEGEYVLNELVVLTSRIAPAVGATVKFSAPTINNALVYAGTGKFFEQSNLTRLYFDRVTVASTGSVGAELFDLNSSVPGAAVVFNNSVFQNWDSFGNLQNIDFLDIFGRFVDIGQGLVITNCNAFSVTNIQIENWKNQASTIMFSLNGTINQIGFVANSIDNNSNENVLYINPAIVLGNAIITANGFLKNGGADFWASGSLDETDTRINVFANSNMKSSSTGVEGFVEGNAEITVINTISVPEKINANWEKVFCEEFVADILLKYSSQTANFTVGEVVTGTVSGAYGTIIADDDQGTTGTLTLNDVVGKFDTTDIITDQAGGSASLDKISCNMRYVGDEDMRVKVTGKVSMFVSSGINIPVSLYISKNGVVIDRSEGSGRVSNGIGSKESFYTQATIDLSTDDYISGWVENEGTTADITVNTADFIINRIK